MDGEIRDLELRLSSLENREQILTTWTDYLYATDTGDLKLYSDLFHQDATFEVVGVDGIDSEVTQGRDQIVARRAKTPVPTRIMNKAGTGHHGSNFRIIRCDGSMAQTSAYFMAILLDNELIAGTYEHVMQNETDRWRIKQMRTAVTYRARVSMDSEIRCAAVPKEHSRGIGPDQI
jgi:hypothetical protein